MSDIVSICRHLSGLHGGTDLPERVRTAFDTQREQRVALAQAADVIQRQSGEIATLKALVVELERTASQGPAGVSLEGTGLQPPLKQEQA